MLVYRPDGVAEDKEPVDARECVKHCGYTFEPKEEPKAVEIPKVVEPVIEQAMPQTDAPKRGRPKMFSGNDVI